MNNYIRNFFRGFTGVVLSDRSILAMNAKGKLIDERLTENQVQPNSVDLTLSDSVSKLNYLERQCIDPKREIKYTEEYFINNPNEDKEFYILQPGEFVLMASNETINVPNGYIAFVAGRSSIARLGIQVEQAGLIDAGFHGTITFEVYNQTKNPIILYEGMRFAQVYFIKAQPAQRPYAHRNHNSKYQRQVLATGSKINKDPELNK